MLQPLDEEVSQSYKDLVRVLKDKDSLFQAYLNMLEKGNIAKEAANNDDVHKELEDFGNSVEAFSHILSQVTSELTDLEQRLEDNHGVGKHS